MAVNETVAIVGSGLIGRAWAMIFARAGWDVRLFDTAEGVAVGAVPLCAEGLRTLAAHGLCADPAGRLPASMPSEASRTRCGTAPSCRRTGRNSRK